MRNVRQEYKREDYLNRKKFHYWEFFICNIGQVTTSTGVLRSFPQSLSTYAEFVRHVPVSYCQVKSTFSFCDLIRH